MNKQVVLFFLVSAVIGSILGFFAFKLTQREKPPVLSPSPSSRIFPTTSPILTPAVSSSSASISATLKNPLKKFVITASNYKFFPNEIRVQKDDKVQITLRNIGGLHNISIPDFKTFSPTIDQGHTISVEFVADTKGTFKFYCGVEDHEERGMTGKLTVE